MSGPLRKSMDPEGQFVSPFNHGRIDYAYDNLQVKLLSWPDETQFGIMATVASSGHAGAKIDLENFSVDELALEDTWKGFNLGQIKEFGKLVFLVTGCSRGFTHEIVRTRVGAAYIQQTMRHTNMGLSDVRMPESMAEIWHHRPESDAKELNPEIDFKKLNAVSAWMDLQIQAQDVYQQLIEADFAYQDARTACTLATETWIIISYDIRSWLDTYAQRRCLSSDSVIHTLSGDKTIMELSLGQDEEFDVYSVNDSGQLDIGKAYRPVKTGHKQLYKITFDTGDTIRLTSDHRVMMRDGSYREVKDLSINDSIMPFNRKYKEGYPIVYENIDHGMISAHKFTVLKKDGIRLPSYKYASNKNALVIHHSNFDKNDNRRENLMVMTSLDHMILHSTIARVPISDDGRRRISERMKKNNPMKDPEIAEKVASQRRGKPSPLIGTKWSEEAKANLSAAAKNGKTGGRKGHRVSEASMLALRNTWKKPWNKGLTAEVDERVSRQGPKGKFNHKIISIELDSIEDVYDMQVDPFHNFAVNGIFVHNCYMFYPEMVQIMKLMKEAVKEKAPWIAEQAKISCEIPQPDGSHKCTYRGAEVVEGYCPLPWAQEENRLWKSVRFNK